MSDGMNYSITEASVLRRAGWWASAVEQAIREALRQRVNGAERNSLTEAVGKFLGYGDLSYIGRRIRHLEDSGDIVAVAARLHLAESTRQSMSDARERRKAGLQKVEQHYEHLRATVPGGGTCPPWATFATEILNPLITELGARTVELLNGTPTLASRPVLEKYLGAEGATKDALREVGTRFFDPENEFVRQHVFGELQSYFLAASHSLDKDILRQLTAARKPSFELLLDTNAVFSLLNLHHNPANEATRYLLDLQKKVEEYATVRFYALRETLDEARSALDGARQVCAQAIRTAAQAQALEGDPPANGLIDRYLEIARSSPVTAETYFAELSTYLEVSCAGVGVEILDEEVRETADMRARVADWMSWQVGASSPRSHAAIKHDLRCLAFVKLKRQPSNSAIVAEAGWWLLTVDQRLRNFERRNIAGNHALPCAIAPDELTQVLQFWSPRPDELERATIVGMRLPFAFYDYDNATQKTSLEILRRMNDFEGADVMSADSTRRILVDKAVRESFEEEGVAPDELQSVLESAAIRELKRVEAERDSLESQLQQAARQVSSSSTAESKRNTIAAGIEQSKRALLKSVEEGRRENKKILARLDRESAKHRDERAKMQRKLDDLIDQSAREKEAFQRLAERLPLVLAVALSSVIGAAFPMAAIQFTADLPGRWYRTLSAALLGVAMWAALTPLLARWFGVRSEWRVVAACRKWRKASWSAIALAVLGAIIQFGMEPPVSEALPYSDHFPSRHFRLDGSSTLPTQGVLRR